MNNINTPDAAQRQAGRQQGAVILLASSLTIMGAVMVAPVLPKIAQELGGTTPHADVLVPLIATGPALAIALFAPLAGWLADRLGRKRLLILATLAYVLSGFAPSQLHALDSILLMRLLFGLAEATIMTCCTTLIGDYWQGDEQQKYVNRQVIAIGLIGAIFFVIGGGAGEASWRYPFYLYLLPALLVPFMVRVLWEPSLAAPVRPADPATAKPAARGAWRAIAVASFLAFAGMTGAFIVPVQTPGLLVHMGVTSTTLIGASAGMGLLATLLGSLLWPLVRRIAGVTMTNAVLLALIASGLIWLTRAASYPEVLAAVSLHGVGAGLLVPNTVAHLLEKLPPSLRARGVGIFTSCLYLGQFVSPLIVALLAGPRQDIPSGIAGYAFVLLLLAGTWAAMALRYRRPALPT